MFFLYFLATPRICRILVPQAGINPLLPAGSTELTTDRQEVPTDISKAAFPQSLGR